MEKIVEDGKERYMEANAEDLEQALRARVADIERSYADRLRGANLFTRALLGLRKHRDLARARREVYGDDSLYVNRLSTPANRA